jgi:single-strand DNA-binding protein
MTSFNKVILLGNLTRDPEVRYTPNGIAVASFALAINRKYKQGDETKEEVIIDGRLQQRRWDDKESGQKRSKVEVVAQSVNFMPKRASASHGSQAQAEPMPEPPVDEGEIPF